MINDVFNSVHHQADEDAKFPAALVIGAEKLELCITDAFSEKVRQLYRIQFLHQGIILLGRASSGKSAVRKLVEAVINLSDHLHVVVYTIDPKVLSKQQLFGNLDVTTREWSDGIFTRLIRHISENSDANSSRHWIIFDGDIDPEWAENLNR